MANENGDKELLRLVSEYCTVDQIKGLLRSAKDRGIEDVRVSALTKEELVASNLRKALDSRAVDREAMHTLVRDAEENGGQHVLYYQVARALSQSLSLSEVGPKIAGISWAQKFPVFDLVPGQFIVADLRLWNPAKKPTDWILKIYGQESFERPTGVVREEADRRILREFSIEDRRVVLVIRWNHPNLLEIRVPVDTSKRRVTSWIAMAWRMLKDIIREDQLRPWDLSKARLKLCKDGPRNAELYRARDTRVKNPRQTHSIESNDVNGTLFDSQEDSELLSRVLDNEGECLLLSVFWLERKNEIVPSREIRTLLSDGRSNELVIPGQCTPRDIDYVTEQLRAFSR